MVGRRRRRKSGEGRIESAIDHFLPMGFKEIGVRNIVDSLLKNVCGKEGWPLLEENCYHVVLEALLEKQEQQKDNKEEAQEKNEQQQEEEEEEEEEEEREEDDEDQAGG